jgi:hypothetical protein
VKKIELLIFQKTLNYSRNETMEPYRFLEPLGGGKLEIAFVLMPRL